MNNLLLQFIALSLYLLFMGFTFCDGFKLHILRKLLWFSVFLIIALTTLKSKGAFDLAIILPVPTLLAFILCWYEKRRKSERQVKKRPKELILLGWAVLVFSTYIFYNSVLILGEYFLMPFSFGDILTRGTLNLRISFLSIVLTHIFSIILFIAGAGVLYLKRWAVILLISILILDLAKKFYLMSVLVPYFSITFIIEPILLLAAIYYFCRRGTRTALR